jgi:amino acid transporter
MVAFAVMASGITSASTLSRAFGGDYLKEFIDVPTSLAALVFIVVVGLVNFRGITASIRTNLVLTAVEITGLVLIVLIGGWVFGSGDGDALVNVAVLALRRERVEHRHFTTPRAFPVLGLVISQRSSPSR